VLQSGFVVAMTADIGVSRYDRPSGIIRHVKRWLIVSRLGQDGEHLTVSDTRVACNGSECAPLGLTPANSLLGVLLSQAPNGDCVFLFSRRRPEPLKIAGTFFPAEGYVRLRGPLSALQLFAEGRHAHSRGVRDGQEIRNDIADPAPNSKLAKAWHVDAVRRPWSGDFVPFAARE
jgi:hypothetical protein